MNRIKSLFQKKRNDGKSAFIAYLVCGDPDIKTTYNLMNIMVESGVDIIELGMPFTDPIADGPTIQKGVERSLTKKTSLKDIFDVVKKFRKKNLHTPIVLMGYMNPIEKIGYEKFSLLSKNCGADGILIVDSPPEESKKINKILKNKDLCQIFLASPTTEKSRLKKIINSTSGYLYYVSIKGITGSKINNYKTIENRINQIRIMSKNKIPITVGFGIKDKKTAKAISKFSDGIIIGSSVVELIEKNIHNKPIMFKNVKNYLKNIHKGMQNR